MIMEINNTDKNVESTAKRKPFLIGIYLGLKAAVYLIEYAVRHSE